MEGGMVTPMVMVTAITIATIMVILIAMTTIIMDSPMDIHIDIPIDMDIVTPIDTRPLLIGEIIIMNQGIDPVISDKIKG